MTSSAPSGGQRRGRVPLLRRLRRPQGLATSASGPATSASITSITWSAAPVSASGPDPRQALTDGPDPRPVLIGAFEKQHPDIRVSLVPAPGHRH